MNGGIRHRSAEKGFDGQLGYILEGYHHEQIVGRNDTQEGYEHEGKGVEPIGYGRASDGAHPKFLTLGLFLDFFHEPCVGKFAQRKPTNDPITIRGT